MLTVLLSLILFACLGILYAEGMWSNAIRLVNVVTAALLATNFFEPAARWLEGRGENFATYAYVWDFLVLWGLFGLFMIVFRTATDFVSRVKVRFLKMADRIGSAVLAAWIGWVMICFTAASLHTAPLARNFLFGNFQPEERMFLGMAPDRKWLGFTQKVSRGVFARSATEEHWKQEKFVFDPRGEFMPKYATRRANLEAHVAKTGAIRIRPDAAPGRD